LSKRILVFDDSSDTVEVVSALVEGKGFSVVTALGGEVALEKVKENQPDLVILDVMMPGMNGLEVLERLRTGPETASIPVIFLTAKDQHSDLHQGYRLGADYYIAKPFTCAQLLYGVNLLQSERGSGGDPRVASDRETDAELG
jgi:CheY-like chemotaxis protein